MSRDVALACSNSGLRIGFTMERAFNRTLKEPLLLARADTNDVPGGRRPRFQITKDGFRIKQGFAMNRREWTEEYVTATV